MLRLGVFGHRLIRKMAYVFSLRWRSKEPSERVRLPMTNLGLAAKQRQMQAEWLDLH
ncbi:MAG: hypothetical protein ABTD50_16845 [Polyangiaceae bacterium]|jgi:hypothetical protein